MKVKSSELVKTLINNLWENYTAEVASAQKADQFLNGRNNVVFFDHLLFRTINTHTGEQPGGIAGIGHLAEVFGYCQISKYSLHDKLLTAAVYQHDEKNKLPKILVSQLEVNHLPGWAQKLVNGMVAETPYPISDNGIELLRVIGQEGSLPFEAGNFLLADLKSYFKRPWNPPKYDEVLKLKEILPYCAWVLLFGNSVARFSLSVHSFEDEISYNLNQACNSLKNIGILMQLIPDSNGFEYIRQAETVPEITSVEVTGEEGIENLRWEYAGLHITERFEPIGKNKQEKVDWPLFHD